MYTWIDYNPSEASENNGALIGNACYEEAQDTEVDPMSIGLFFEDSVKHWQNFAVFCTEKRALRQEERDIDEKELEHMRVMDKWLFDIGPDMLLFWEGAYDAVYVKIEEEKQRMLMEGLEELSLEDLNSSDTPSVLRCPAYS